MAVPPYLCCPWLTAPDWKVNLSCDPRGQCIEFVGSALCVICFAYVPNLLFRINVILSLSYWCSQNQGGAGRGAKCAHAACAWSQGRDEGAYYQLFLAFLFFVVLQKRLCSKHKNFQHIIFSRSFFLSLNIILFLFQLTVFTAVHWEWRGPNDPPQTHFAGLWSGQEKDGKKPVVFVRASVRLFLCVSRFHWCDKVRVWDAKHFLAAGKYWLAAWLSAIFWYFYFIPLSF